MDIQAITTLLLKVTNLLLFPVVGILLFFLVIMIVYLGGFIREAVQRWTSRSAFETYLDTQKQKQEPICLPQDIPEVPGLIERGVNRLKTAPRHFEQILDDLQLEMERQLTPLSLGIRLGPVFGLAGTLIPLGPALMSLSTGNIQLLSSRLVVAFSTTVIGLLIGGICFAMKIVRQNWYNQDLNDLEFIARHMESHEKHSKSRKSDE